MSQVQVELRSGVLHIVFNRPEKKNALTRVMYQAMADALRAANDDKAVRATRRNLQEAGFGGIVTVDRGDLLETQPLTDHGILVANPPYGERIGEQDELAAFYPRLGAALKRHWAGWNCFFFTADLRLPKLVGLKPSRKTPLFNGPLECRLFEIRMVAGSNRKA